MQESLTLGSLFDGSGGFPLGGILCGIQPVWASEIEPFPIRVTTKRLPGMKHYGDVSTLSGARLEPVDIITFGSPCTDMSIAGKRAGLGGQQSVLFYEAIRIIREMREATHGEYPRYAVWENVPGCFSSNGGNDFKAVLEAFCGICEPSAEVPAPEKGAWSYADVYMGNGWSIAYRVIDAQYFGVAQRRRRVYLVADLNGERAGEILFEREGVSRDIKTGCCARQGTAGYAEEGAGAAGCNDRVASTLYASYGTKWNGNAGAYSGDNFAFENTMVLNDQGGNRMDVTENVTSTLRAEAHHPPCVLSAAGFCTEHSAKSRGIGFEEEMSPTLRAGVVPAAVAIENHPIDGRCKIEENGTVQTLTSRMGTGGMNTPLVLDTPKTLKIRTGCEGGGKGALIQDDISATLSCNNDQTLFQPCAWDGGQLSPTLTANNAGGNQRMPDKDNFNCVLQAYGISSDRSNAMLSDNPHSGIYEADTARTLDASGGNPCCNQGGIAVVALQGSMIGRSDKNGPQGSGINEDISFTLDAADRHAVAYAMTTGCYTQITEEQAPTLQARDYKDAPIVNQPYQEVAGTIAAGAHPSGFNGQDAYSDRLIPMTNGTDYIVRRLTPLECARLQGFPDCWCAALGTEEPTESDIAFWSEVWETHRRIMGTSEKPKSRKQIEKWLRDPYSDAAAYKMWGNGVALPCVCFVLDGIVETILSEKP